MADLLIKYQSLRKPPRLKNDGNGYDWRELDRWFLQIWMLLGPDPDENKTVNLFTGLENIKDEITSIYASLAMVNSSDSQGVRDILLKVKDVEMKIDMLAVSEQEIRENRKRILDTDTLTNMGE
jgi:hypothetical protein